MVAPVYNKFMWQLLILSITCVQSLYGASFTLCPEQCRCNNDMETVNVVCDNFDFIDKLVPKQYTSITQITINGTYLQNINPKLKYLKNINYLDLSHNNIFLNNLPPLNELKTLKLCDIKMKDIRLSYLPQNIEHLDLSHNYLSQIPKDWSHLKHLKSLNLTKNPIFCDCQNVLMYKEMKRHNINFPNLVTCGAPESSRGKNIDSIECSPIDLMLGDSEGSGLSETESGIEENVPIMEDENNIINENSWINESVQASVKSSEEESFNVNAESVSGESEEGSGFGLHDEVLIPEVKEEESSQEEDNGSGLVGIPEFSNLPDLMKPCSENCSEHEGLDDEENASPLPSIKDQLHILNGDLFNFNDNEEVTTTSTEPNQVEEIIAIKEDVKQVSKVSIPKEVEHEPDELEHDKEGIVDNTKLERAFIGSENGSNSTIYIVIAVAVMVIICVLIFFVKKKRSLHGNKRKQIAEDGLGEELKPLEKKIVPMNEKLSSPMENTPLMNGNGKIIDENSKIDIPEKDSSLAFTDVDLRSDHGLGLLAPIREKVTIKETEIPESIPKTPLLVHREVSSDGKIILTPVDN